MCTLLVFSFRGALGIREQDRNYCKLLRSGCSVTTNLGNLQQYSLAHTSDGDGRGDGDGSTKSRTNPAKRRRNRRKQTLPFSSVPSPFYWVCMEFRASHPPLSALPSPSLVWTKLTFSSIARHVAEKVAQCRRALILAVLCRWLAERDWTLHPGGVEGKRGAGSGESQEFGRQDIRGWALQTGGELDQRFWWKCFPQKVNSATTKLR